MTLFIVESQYQLMNALQIQRHCLANKADIIVLNSSDGAVECYNAAKQFNCFANVEIVDIGYYGEKNKIKYYICRLRAVIHPTRLVPVKIRKRYENIFFTGTNIYCKVVANYFYTTFKSAQLNLYEEGYGTYANILKKHIKDRRIKITNCIMGYDILEIPKNLYVYCPMLVQSDYVQFNIRKIPPFSKTDCEIVNRVYHNITNYITLPKGIFLESNFASEKYSDVTKIQENVLSFLTKRLTNKELAVKYHPTDEQKKEYAEYKIKWKGTLEQLAMSQPIDNNVLISIVSTACVTPKLLTNQEPIIIWLYKIVPNYKEIFMETDTYVNRIRQIYSFPEKIYCPKTMMELNEIVDEIFGTNRKQSK